MPSTSTVFEPPGFRARRRWTARTAAVLLAGLCVIGSTAAGAPATDLEGRLRDLEITPFGAPAPPFALLGLDGQRYALADLAGRPALLYFWATW